MYTHHTTCPRDAGSGALSGPVLGIRQHGSAVYVGMVVKSFCGLHCRKGLALWCSSDVDIVHYGNSGRLPFCLNSSRPLFDMWGHAFSGWHDAMKSTLCNIRSPVVHNLCWWTDNFTLQVPVHMYIYRYRVEDVKCLLIRVFQFNLEVNPFVATTQPFL